MSKVRHGSAAARSKRAPRSAEEIDTACGRLDIASTTFTITSHLKHALSLVDARLPSAPDEAARRLLAALTQVERDARRLSSALE